MTEAESRGPRRRRVLVAIDARAAAQADFEASARLAAGLQAELVGLLIEDVALIAAAQLPVTRLIRAGGREPAALNSAAMRRALRIAQSEARDRLAQTARRWRLPWSFEVTAAAAAREALAQLRAEDLLALSGPRPAWRPDAAPCAVMVQRRGGRRRQPVAVVYEGEGLALELARDLARVYESRLLVLVADQEARAEVLEWMAEEGISGTVERLCEQDCPGLAGRLSALYPSAIVFDRHASLGRCLDPDRLAEAADSVVVFG